MHGTCPHGLKEKFFDSSNDTALEVLQEECLANIIPYWMEVKDYKGKTLVYGNLLKEHRMVISEDGPSKCWIAKWLCRGCGKNCDGEIGNIVDHSAVDPYFEEGNIFYPGEITLTFNNKNCS